MRFAGSTRSRLVVCGLLLGGAGLLLFGTIHAFIIVPIWSRLIRGLPFALVLGLAVTWAYHEYRKAASPTPAVGAGLRFGALIWLAGLPATALGFGMRLTQDHGPVPWWVDGATVALAALGGATLLWGLTRTRRGAIAGAIALGVLSAPNGGPMPIENMSRGLGLPAGFLVVEAFGGVVLALLYTWLVAPALRVEHTLPQSSGG